MRRTQWAHIESVRHSGASRQLGPDTTFTNTDVMPIWAPGGLVPATFGVCVQKGTGVVRRPVPRARPDMILPNSTASSSI